MSGVKTGVAAPAVVAQTALPVLGAGLAVLGVAKAGQFAFEGAVRVSRKMYGALQEKAAEVAREQIQRMQEEIARLSRVYGEAKVQGLISPPEQILEDSVSLETLQEAALQHFLKHLEQHKGLREEYEEARNLRHDISLKIAEEIEAYQRKLAEIRERKERQKAKREASFRQLDEERQQQYLGLLEQVQPLIGPMMETLYPEKVEKLRKALENQEEDLSTLDKFEDNKYYQELRKKAALLNEPQVQAQLARLRDWRVAFQSNPLLSSHLEDEERQEVQRKFNAKRHKAERGKLTDADMADLDRMQDRLLEACRQRDEQRRFEDAEEKAKTALINQGYTRIKLSVSPDQRYRVLTGINPDTDQRATIRLIRPGVSDEGIPHFHLEVDDSTYDREEDWIQAGQRLAWEVESMGLYVSFEEAMTHFKNRLRAQTLEDLQNRLQEANKDIRIELADDALIRVDGKEFLWKVGTSLEEFSKFVLDSLSREKGRRELPPDPDRPNLVTE